MAAAIGAGPEPGSGLAPRPAACFDAIVATMSLAERGSVAAPSRRAVFAVGAACLAATVLHAIGPFLSSYRMKPTILSAIVYTAVGASFMGAGLVAWIRRPGNRIGPLMIGVGLAFFLPVVWWTRNPIAAVVGVATVNWYQAFLVHLALAFPTGRLRSRTERIVVVAIYVWIPLNTSVMDVLLFDPRAHGCPECPANPLLLSDSPSLRDALSLPFLAVGIALTVIVLVLIRGHWRAASARSRRALAPVAWAALPAAAVIVGQNVAAALDHPPSWVVWALFQVGPLVLVVFPIGFLAALLRSRLDRASVGDLVLELERGVPIGGLRDLLARSLGDPELDVGFWVSDPGTWMAGDGRPLELPPAGARRSATILEADGGPFAVLVHDPALDDERELVRSVGAAAHMALENERLQAEVRAQLAEVRSSRERIVAAADDARRRLERDLHDGAQQRLVTLAISLQRATRRASDDPELVATLAQVESELRRSLEELRELARGIHPAILTESGLGAALESLAERSSVPARVEGSLDGRLPAAVEATAYFVASEALANAAKHAGASEVVVRVEQRDGLLHLEVRDDGCGGATSTGSGLRGLADRVATVGGRFTVSSPNRAGTTIVAELPCGS
jgi:signal transduction histidine kinase